MTEGEAGLNFREPSQPEVLAPIRRRELNASFFDSYGEEFMRALAAEEQFVLAEVSRPPLRSPVRACVGYNGLRGAYARRSSSR